MVDSYDGFRMRSQYCRREETREKWSTGEVTFWSKRSSRPSRVSAIEADARGARLLLPSEVTVGDFIHVCFADEVGQYQSFEARVVWTHGLAVSGKQIAGVMFLDETGSMSIGLAGAGHGATTFPAQASPSWSHAA